MPGPAAEFTEFARAHTPALLRSAFLLTGDQHLAEDLVQVALSRTHRYWHRIDGNAPAYTRRIMYHLQVSWWRKKRVREQFSDEPPHGSASGRDDADLALKLTVRDALMGLSKKQRAVVVLRFFEDLSVGETAAILGCTPGTVKVQTSRALSHLRSALPELAERGR